MYKQQDLDKKISEYYIDIKPNKKYLDIYVVRKAIFNFIKQNLNNISGDILDLGCGIMPYRNFILLNTKCDKYIGIDFDTSLNDEYSLVKPDITWDGKKIPLANNTIDVILCTELLEHCSNADEILGEIYRVLKPGGKVLFTVPFLWNLHLIPFDEFRYTPFSLKRLLEKSGFNSIDLRALGAWDASLAQMLGIWYQQRPLKRRYYYYTIIKQIIIFLLKKDSFYDKRDVFKEGLMITGICGIAFKSK